MNTKCTICGGSTYAPPLCLECQDDIPFDRAIDVMLACADQLERMAVVTRKLIDARTADMPVGKEHGRLGNLNNLIGSAKGASERMRVAVNIFDPARGKFDRAPRKPSNSSDQMVVVPKQNKKNTRKNRAQYKSKKPPERSAPRSTADVRKRQKINKQIAEREKHRNGCTGKNRYTYQDAIAVASRIVEQNPHISRMAVYVCFLCGEHHLTKNVKDSKHANSTQLAVISAERL